MADKMHTAQGESHYSQNPIPKARHNHAACQGFGQVWADNPIHREALFSLLMTGGFEPVKGQQLGTKFKVIFISQDCPHCFEFAYKQVEDKLRKG